MECRTLQNFSDYITTINKFTLEYIYELSTYILKFKFWLCLHGVGRECYKKLESGSWSEKVENPCYNTIGIKFGAQSSPNQIAVPYLLE